MKEDEQFIKGDWTLMKKWTLPFLSIVLAAGLAACGDDNADTANEGEHGDMEAGEGVYPLEVDLELPESAAAGEEVTIRAKVTMNEEIVDDANEVEFEIEDGSGESEWIDGEFDGDEYYIIEKSFDEPGTYSVTSHVTAREQHTMPKKEITVE